MTFFFRVRPLNFRIKNDFPLHTLAEIPFFKAQDFTTLKYKFNKYLGQHHMFTFIIFFFSLLGWNFPKIKDGVSIVPFVTSPSVHYWWGKNYCQSFLIRKFIKD